MHGSVLRETVDQIGNFQNVGAFVERDALLDRQRNSPGVAFASHQYLNAARFSANGCHVLAISKIATLDRPTFLHRNHIDVIVPKMVDQRGSQSVVVLQSFVKIGLFKHNQVVNAGGLIGVLVLTLENFGMIKFRATLDGRSKVVPDRAEIQFVNLTTMLRRDPSYDFFIRQPDFRAPIKVVIVGRCFDPDFGATHRVFQ